MAEHTTIICFCIPRLEAEAAGTFQRSSLGWFFPNDQPRRASWRAKYYGPDMTGHPMRWHECPYCGHTLPSIDTLRPPAEPTGGCEGEFGG